MPLHEAEDLISVMLSMTENEKYHVYSSLLDGYISMDHPTKDDAQKFIDQYHNSQYNPGLSRQKEPLRIIPVKASSR